MNNSHHTAITKRICEQKSRICTDLIRCICEAPIAACAKYLMGSYSRDMETDADHFALELMGDASIETQSTAKLFRTISTESRYAEIASFLTEILSSHPEMTGRIDLFEQSNITGTLDINPQDWKALQTVCD